MKKERKVNIFRSFRSRNFTLYFTGQSVSQIGTWIQGTAVSWVVYSLTHSPFMLGVAMFAQLFPRFILSPAGGILADRYNRYRLLLITQVASMIQATILAVLTLTNHYTVFELLALSALLGAINAFDSPARQPLIHEIVFDEEDLPNAVALNSSMVNFARIIGPAIAGIILMKLGAGTCFLLNAVSFLAVIISLLLMKLPDLSVTVQKKNKLSADLSEGVKYIRSTPEIGMILLLISISSLLVLPYETLLPVFAKEVFKGDATTFGYIRSFIGIGAIGGTFFLASLKPGADLKIVLLVNSILLGAGLMLFSVVNSFQLAMIFAVIFGFGALSQTTICLTLVQVNTDAKMRGRIISFLIMALTGMSPIGSLAVGAISQVTGAPAVLFGEGVLALVIVIAFSNFLRGKKRMIERKGEQIIEEVE